MGSFAEIPDEEEIELIFDESYLARLVVPEGDAAINLIALMLLRNDFFYLQEIARPSSCVLRPMKASEVDEDGFIRTHITQVPFDEAIPQLPLTPNVLVYCYPEQSVVGVTTEFGSIHMFPTAITPENMFDTDITQEDPYLESLFNNFRETELNLS